MGMDDGARVERLGMSKMSHWSFCSIWNVSSTNASPHFVPLIASLLKSMEYLNCQVFRPGLTVKWQTYIL